MSADRMRILLIGGYGVFGGRLVDLLVDEPRLTVLVAGRSLEAAQRFVASRRSAAQLIPIALERDGDLAPQLHSERPAVVIDASGPFQAYAERPYRVAEACIDAGCHYLDFADASDFVAGITTLDAAARRRGVTVLSGVSSFPVLTAAVVRHLASGLARVESVAGGIAPSPYAGVGLNVINAIASYAGKRVKLVRNGVPAHGHGLTETRSWTIAPPGVLPLRRTRFSLVDVPDLQALPPLWPGLRDLWMGAGPRPEPLHRALNALAHLVRLQIVPTLAPFARVFHRAINTVRWGEHRGGMIVEISGLDEQGCAHARSWHMVADGDDGPLIPSMAIAIIVRQMLSGKVPAPGARAAVNELGLADYERAFAGRAIRSGVRSDADDDPRHPLYRRVLGAAWTELPRQLQRMHAPGRRLRASGRATVECGAGVLARLVGRVFGFPAAGVDVPVSVVFDVAGEREIWTRDFAGARFSSIQELGRGREQHLIVERFGPFFFGLGLVWDGTRLRLVPRTWRLWGLPLPNWLMPCGESYETVAEDRFAFDVEIALPLIGRVVRYRGTLEPEPAVPGVPV